jgi:hypothetical protein
MPEQQQHLAYVGFHCAGGDVGFCIHTRDPVCGRQQQHSKQQQQQQHQAQLPAADYTREAHVVQR